MRRSVAPVVAIALATAACAGDDDTAADSTAVPTSTSPTSTAVPTSTSTTTTTTTTTSTTSTTVPELPATAPSEPGPHPVGVMTLALPAGHAVEVWYPAAEGTSGSDTYDVRDFVPDTVRDLLTADVPATYTTPAVRDAAPATPPDGGFPLIASSHGVAGIRVVSSFLTAHLASWGMIVVAPDHPARDLRSQLGGGIATPPDPVDDLAASIGLAIAEGAPGGRLAGLVDEDRIALIGHSAGGGTILGVAASDARIDGYVSMASGRLGGDGGPMPDVPSFFLAGALDAVVPAADRTRPAFAAAPAPSRYWLIDGVGHNGFDDLCTLGGGTGIIGVAEASGLGGLLDAQPQFRALGEDGCVPPARPVDETFPVIRHGVTVWLLDLFGASDGLTTDLGPEIGELYGVPITVEATS